MRLAGGRPLRLAELADDRLKRAKSAPGAAKQGCRCSRSRRRCGASLRRRVHDVREVFAVTWQESSRKIQTGANSDAFAARGEESRIFFTLSESASGGARRDQRDRARLSSLRL